ncbi:MAG: PaaI family thioesterase [Burkholderiales bacterium]|jgi:uncharacterized protein (TIGR00369 family)|nr:PaaI family thioesterase [Burkholderiales bacterium]
MSALKPYDPAEHGWKTLNSKGFFAEVGPLWSRRLNEGWEYGLLVEPRHENGVGVVHGGMLVTLLDQAISLVAWAANEQQPCTTIHLDTHFVAPSVAGDFIIARGEVARKTSSLIFLRGTLMVNDKQIMYGQGIMKILRSK